MQSAYMCASLLPPNSYYVVIHSGGCNCSVCRYSLALHSTRQMAQSMNCTQMNLQVILIEWQKGCKHIHVSWFAYVIWSANVVGNVDHLTACSMTVCMCSILTCDHNDENFSFSFHQCLMHIFFKQKSRKCSQDLWHKTKNSEHI